MSDFYEVNGRRLLSPTTFRWLPRGVLDVQGDNRPIYSSVRGAELRWVLSYVDQFALLLATFNEMQSTGTAVVNLPAYPDYLDYPSATGIAYGFREYSGCILAEPMMGPFFEGFPTDVALIIGNIVTR
jgi:hypothetical protein